MNKKNRNSFATNRVLSNQLDIFQSKCLLLDNKLTRKSAPKFEKFSYIFEFFFFDKIWVAIFEFKKKLNLCWTELGLCSFMKLIFFYISYQTRKKNYNFECQNCNFEKLELFFLNIFNRNRDQHNFEKTVFFSKIKISDVLSCAHLVQFFSIHKEFPHLLVTR